MKILMVGDIVGSPGRKVFSRVVAQMKKADRVDFVVVNGENAAGGRGITPVLAEELLSAGADVITLGDHTWDQKDLRAYLKTEKRIVRPANFAPECPGNGFVTVDSAAGAVTVINLVGRVFMKPYDCPFRKVSKILETGAGLGGIKLVDFHAEATSEKIVMGRYLNGKVAAVVGTHTHVQTSDECILSDGTAYITDLGMTGPKDSAIGRELDSVTSMMLTGMPAGFAVAKNDVVLEGVIIEVDRVSSKAVSIERVRERGLE